MATLFLTLLKDSPKHEAKQKSFLHTLPGARATCGMHAHAPPPARPVHVPRLACPAPLPGASATCGMHTARRPHAAPPPCPVHVPRLACPAPCPAQVPHVVSMDSARPAPMPGARATCGTHTARSAFCPAHVPHVARTPHAPPLAWRTCHTWHVRRTLRPLPGSCATRGMHAAGSAPARRMCHTWHYVPHVASHRRRRPLAWIMCHTWHHAARPAPGPANPNQGLPGARCVPRVVTEIQAFYAPRVV